MLTGHGSFGSYLYRIEKWDTDRCPHCEEGCADTADHTISVCSAWSLEREDLMNQLGLDLSLKGKIVEEILKSRDKWKAFSDRVMLRKEMYERDREREIREWEQLTGAMRPESPASGESERTSGDS